MRVPVGTGEIEIGSDGMNLRIEYDSYKIKDDITIEEIRLAIQYIQIKRETGKVSKDTCYKEEIYYGKRIK